MTTVEPEIVRFQQRCGTAQEWEQANPILLAGEIGVVLGDPVGMKIGDGRTPWLRLPEVDRWPIRLDGGSGEVTGPGLDAGLPDSTFDLPPYEGV